METNRDAVIGAGDYWLAAMQLNTMGKLPAKFKLELTCRCSGLLLQPVSCQITCQSPIAHKVPPTS